MYLAVEHFKQKRMEDKLRHLSKSGGILQPICFICALGESQNAERGILFNHLISLLLQDLKIDFLREGVILHIVNDSFYDNVLFMLILG